MQINANLITRIMFASGRGELTLEGDIALAKHLEEASKGDESVQWRVFDNTLFATDSAMRNSAKWRAKLKTEQVEAKEVKGEQVDLYSKLIALKIPAYLATEMCKNKDVSANVLAAMGIKLS